MKNASQKSYEQILIRNYPDKAPGATIEAEGGRKSETLRIIRTAKIKSQGGKQDGTAYSGRSKPMSELQETNVPAGVSGAYTDTGDHSDVQKRRDDGGGKASL